MMLRSPSSIPARAALAVLGALATSHGSAAGGAPQPQLQPTPEQRQACKADLQRLCPGTMPGGGRVRACLETNLSQLSPLCREAYEATAPAA